MKAENPTYIVQSRRIAINRYYRLGPDRGGARPADCAPPGWLKILVTYGHIQISVTM